MLTRSKSRKLQANTSNASSASSISSTATIKAQKLAAEAMHLRRIADLERAQRELELERAARERDLELERAARERDLELERAAREREHSRAILETERAVLEAEHRAEIAALEVSECGSQRSSRHSSRCSGRRSNRVATDVKAWLDDTLNRAITTPQTNGINSNAQVLHNSTPAPGGSMSLDDPTRAPGDIACVGETTSAGIIEVQPTSSLVLEEHIPTSLSATAPLCLPAAEVSTLKQGLSGLSLTHSNLCTVARSEVSGIDRATMHTSFAVPQPVPLQEACGPPYQRSYKALAPSCAGVRAPLIAHQPTLRSDGYARRQLSAPAPLAPQHHTTTHVAQGLVFAAPLPTTRVTSVLQEPATMATELPTALGFQPQPLHYSLGTQNIDVCNKNNKPLENPDSTQNLAQAIANATVAANKAKVRFPLPVFEGRPTDWLTFKKMYDDTSRLYSPLENLMRLNAALRGTARDSVAVLLAAARDPLEVVRALETVFARPEQIIVSEISAARALPKLSSQESASELNTFACKVRNCVEVVRLLQRPEYLASPELSNEIVGKLTPLLRTRWADFAFCREASNPGKYRLELLSDFLMQEADLRARYHVYTVPDLKGKSGSKDSCHATTTSGLPTGVASPNAAFSTGTTVLTAVTSPQQLPEKMICAYCEGPGHDVRTCKKFIALTSDKRWEWVSHKKCCHKCLIQGAHRYRTCKKFSCEVEGCKGKRSHHTLLHKTTLESSTNESSPARVVVGHNFASSSVTPVNRPLLKIVAVTISGPTGSYDTFALLDDGSTATLIDSSVTSAIGAQGRTSFMRVDGIGGMFKESEVSFVDVEIKGRHSHKSYSLKNVRSIPNLGLSRQTVAFEDVKSFDYLTDIVDVLTYGDIVPKILIGIDNWHLTASHQTRRGSLSQPVASLTALGWVLYGSLKCKSKESYNCVSVNHVDFETINSENLDASLDLQLQEYFRVDSIGISKQNYFSKNDQIAINVLEETTKRLPSGQFETGLLWAPDVATMTIPNSFELARSRFSSLEKKMKRDGHYAAAYQANIQSMLAKDYAEPCDTWAGGGVLWYLPHFGVIHPQKRKLRVVHDAAATCSGVSLNSMLLSGPDILQPLVAILMRFREGRIALNGDIREMFPQTKIRLEDRDAQRFLWRNDSSEPLKEYRMSSMIFGAVSSPFTALYLKNKNAEEHRNLFPAAADAIVNDHYMDDYLGSVNLAGEARQLAADVTHVHAQAGLEMRSWVSNSLEALSLLPPELCLTNASSVDVRVLGVSWNVHEDTLCFSRNSFGNLPDKLTKRSVLSHLMRLYDPLGLLTPLTIRGRILFQKTCRLCTEWDQELSSKFAVGWNAWFEECKGLLSGSIPRHYLAHKEASCHAQLHVFADASELAYACVAYWRFECLDGSVKLGLIGGKARLAPLKPLSIPRLELQAALIAARYATYISEAHKLFKIAKLTFWTDSLTVLRWLRSDARTFKPFVAHRIGEIAEITNVSNWRHVPTALNVADDATRVDPKFEIDSRWFSGPPFLNLPESEWPTEPSTVPLPICEELKRIPSELVALTNARDLPTPVVPDTTRFSKWLRLLRATARVFVCARIFKATLLDPTSLTPNSAPVCREPTAEDLKRAEERLLLHSQLASLREDYILIDRGEQPAKNSRLKNLTLFIENSTRLLRLAGRIRAVEGLPTISPDPIVLDGKHRVVRLLIAHYHERAAHSSNELVVNELRQFCHIIGLRPAVKSVASSCLRCRIRKAVPIIPPVGDLPPERLAHHVRPFTHVGLDYFGPISVSVGRHSEKRYVALFTCLTVRAVHLEVVGNLSTDSAIMALRRFIARRGTPTTLYSDNGTAFVGASRLLQTLYAQPLQEFATNQRIQWKFIPPSSPFMGGCWERLVRSIKTALSATLVQRTPSEEVFHTFLLEAEALVNSRPLTHVNVAPEEDGAITPFHFLLGSSSPYSMVAQLDDGDLIRRVRWRRGLRLADHFWTRWTREYLPTLIPKGSSAPNKNIEVGDQVLIVDGNLPRGVWPRGRVTRTFPGKDDVVRVVEVSCQAGTLRRPVRKLVLLPS